jgi:hypothetical protein
LQKKLKECLTEAIQGSDSLPHDIVSQFESLEQHKQQLVDNSFTESEQTKHRRLAEEFDIIHDAKNTEREYVN